MKADKIIVALDTQNKEKLDFYIKELAGSATFVKVGMELFYTFGTDIIQKLKVNGFKVFLDLKMHDIPNTVANTAKVLAKLDVDVINLHAAGGSEMMKRAAASYREYKQDGLIIAVTHLTSTSEVVLRDQIGIHSSMEQAIFQYAKLAKESSIDGVVCSAFEVKRIKEGLGHNFKCITPGIRPTASSNDDQARVMNPTQALLAGSDYLVIGRPITQAQSPRLAFQKILEEI